MSSSVSGVTVRETGRCELSVVSADGCSTSAAGIDAQGNSVVMITGLKITGCRYGILGIDESSITIEGCELGTIKTVAIDISGVSRGVMSGVVVSGTSEYGVRVGMEGECRVDKADIEGKTGIGVSGNGVIKGAGIRLNYSQYGVRIIENGRAELSEQTMIGAMTGESGIEVQGSGMAVMKGLALTGAGCGVRVSMDGECTISGAQITGAVGVDISGNGIVRGEGVSVSSTRRGIQLGMDGQCTVSRGAIAGDDGIEVRGNGRLKIASYLITAIKNGIVLRDQADAHIHHCTIVSGVTGIGLHDVSIAAIEDNSLSSPNDSAPTTTGIYINTTEPVVVSHNKINNISYGIAFVNPTYTAMGNTITAKCEKFHAVDTLPIIDRESALESAYMLNIIHRQERARLRTFKNIVRRIVLSTYAVPVINRIYRNIYYLGLKVLVFYIGHSPSVKSLFLRRGIHNQDWIPGSSDIDLMMVIKSQPVLDEKQAIKNMWSRYEFLKKIFPFLGELQMVNEEELNNYLFCGDIKAWEASLTWKCIAGKEMPLTAYRHVPAKYHLDCLNEIYNAYKVINDVFFNRDRHVNAKHLFLKMLFDIIKYSLYSREGTVIGRFQSRIDVLDTYMLLYPADPAIPLLALARHVWIKNEDMDAITYTRIFSFVFRLVKDTALLFRQHHYECFVPTVSSYAVKVYTPNVRADADTLNTAAFSRRLHHASNGSLQSFIVDAPGLMYIVLDEETDIREDFIEIVQSMYEVTQVNAATRHTPIVFLTHGMYQILLATLPCENPFMYYQLLEDNVQEAVDGLLLYRGNEDRTQWSIRKSSFSSLNGSLLTDTIYEAVALLTISWRLIVGAGWVNRDTFIYLFDRLLSLHLALEKNIIISQNIDFAIQMYGVSFPESIADLNYCAELYLSDSSRKEFTGRAYGFFTSVIERMNMLLRERINERKHKEE